MDRSECCDQGQALDDASLKGGCDDVITVTHEWTEYEPDELWPNDGICEKITNSYINGVHEPEERDEVDRSVCCELGNERNDATLKMGCDDLTVHVCQCAGPAFPTCTYHTSAYVNGIHEPDVTEEVPRE